MAWVEQKAREDGNGVNTDVGPWKEVLCPAALSKVESWEGGDTNLKLIWGFKSSEHLYLVCQVGFYYGMRWYDTSWVAMMV